MVHNKKTVCKKKLDRSSSLTEEHNEEERTLDDYISEEEEEQSSILDSEDDDEETIVSALELDEDEESTYEENDDDEEESLNEDESVIEIPISLINKSQTIETPSQFSVIENVPVDKIVKKLAENYTYKKSLINAKEKDVKLLNKAFPKLANEIIQSYDGSTLQTDLTQDLVGEKYLAEQIKRIKEENKTKSILDKYSHLLFQPSNPNDDKPTRTSTRPSTRASTSESSKKNTISNVTPLSFANSDQRTSTRSSQRISSVLSQERTGTAASSQSRSTTATSQAKAGTPKSQSRTVTATSQARTGSTLSQNRTNSSLTNRTLSQASERTITESQASERSTLESQSSDRTVIDSIIHRTNSVCKKKQSQSIISTRSSNFGRDPSCLKLRKN